MLASWMGWILGVTALLVVTARLAERVAVRLRWPSRWTWIAALVSVVVAAATSPAWVGEATALDGPRLDVVRNVTEQDAGASTATLQRSQADRVFLLLWLASSLLFFGRVAYSLLRLRALQRRWPTVVLDGQPVWITDTVGPALVGFVSPRVAVPRWLADWEPSDRRMILRHELEHASARDPLLNAFSTAVVGLLPWNPFLWWARARLLEAIEIDCDGRVLRASQDPRSYAQVLLEVARLTVPMRSSLAALTVANSQLERRIEMAMKHNTPRRLSLGPALLAVAGLAAVLAAVARAPDRPSTSYLAGLMPVAPVAPAAQVPPDLGGGLIPGRLPFTPTPEQTSTALAMHHPRVLARGLPEDERVWFVIDAEMRILHTGVGPAEGLHERVRSLHPQNVTDFVMEIGYQSVDGLELTTVWFVPEPPEPQQG